MRLLVVIAALSLLFVTPRSAVAQEGAPAAMEPVAMETGDAVRGWQAVGRLLMGERGMCTAALVAPRQIVTAAHCLFDHETGARVVDDLITFEAGWRLGRAEAYRGITRSVVDPEYVYSGSDAVERIGHDLALLELDRAIALPHLSPFAAGAQPAPGDRVTVVSYAQDRTEAPAIERDCPVLGQQGHALILACSVDFGSSGAPVFALHEGGAELISVIVAKAEFQGRRVALAVPLGEGFAALADAMAGSDGLSGTRLRGVRILSGGSAGANFISP